MEVLKKREAMTVKIYPEIHEAMKKKAAEIPTTLSLAIEEACEAWLKENEFQYQTGHTRAQWNKVWQKTDKESSQSKT
jgi:hypothetical protein